MAIIKAAVYVAKDLLFGKAIHGSLRYFRQHTPKAVLIVYTASKIHCNNVPTQLSPC